MGSIDPQNPFWCCFGDCGRRGWVDIDGMGFLCCVCFRKEENGGAHKRLLAKLSKSSTTAFEAFLVSHDLAMTMLEFVYGDGWEEQCPCRRCPQEWLNVGWICPIDFHKQFYLEILDARFRAAGISHLQARNDNLDWDIMVAQLHAELYVTFDDVIIDDGSAASFSPDF